MVNADMAFPLGVWLDEQLKNGKLNQSAYSKICLENAKRIFNL